MEEQRVSEAWPDNCRPDHLLHKESWQQQQRQEAMMISSSSSSSSAIKEIPFHFSADNLAGPHQSFEPQSPTDLQEEYERKYYHHHHKTVPSPSDWGSYGQQQLRNNNVLFDGSADSMLSDDMMRPPISFPNLKSSSSSSQVKQEGERRGDSVSDCSEDDDEQKGRKRRKKLNDRLYALRSLVPKITKIQLSKKIERNSTLRTFVWIIQNGFKTPLSSTNRLISKMSSNSLC
ncbi:hypothetical protein AMTRI_Chr11g101830 [Amborella trichopoda]